MLNDKTLIFEQYLKILEEGIKSQAGVGGTTGAASPEEVGRRSTRVNQLRLRQDKENGKVFNVLELMSEYYSQGVEQVKKEIAKYMGDEKTKSVLNPRPPITDFAKDFYNSYEIPLYDLPNRILSIRGLKTPNPDASSADFGYQRFLNKADKALSALYNQETGGNAEDTTELDGVRSFMTRLVRLSKNAGETPRTVLQRARVGGTGANDPTYIHITNLKEESPRFFKYANLLFGFDVRAGEQEPTPEPKRQEDAQRIMSTKVMKHQMELMKQGLRGPELKSAVEKFRAELAAESLPQATNVSNSPTPKPKKKPAAKKKTPSVNKESYFIKVIPF